MRKKEARATKQGQTDSVEPRPEIFRYHGYQAFLKDWLAYRKASQSGFSLRSLAEKAGLAAGYLPMVLSGKRPLTAKALNKISPFLGLSPSELSFLESLLVLGTSESHQALLASLERMKRFPLYQKHNPRESEVYEYLTHWYYVAIREMAALPGFRLDPLWVQSQLQAPVPLKDVKAALEFLVQNGYLKTDASGAVVPPEKALDCTGDVYRVALSQFHREIFELAAQSIATVPREERKLIGHTFALGADEYAQAQAIVDEAIGKIQALGQTKTKPLDSVYHMEIALFPLSKRRKSQ